MHSTMTIINQCMDVIIVYLHPFFINEQSSPASDPLIRFTEQWIQRSSDNIKTHLAIEQPSLPIYLTIWIAPEEFDVIDNCIEQYISK